MALVATVAAVAAVAVDLRTISGPWMQAYSDYYVQSSSEIDWKCVGAEFVVHNETLLTLNKHARLHGLLRSNVNSSKNYTVVTTEDHRVFLKNGNTTLRTYFPIPDCIVFISMNNLTLFVMTRDYDQFMMNNNNEALQFLKEKNMTGVYKAPLVSYTGNC